MVRLVPRRNKSQLRLLMVATAFAIAAGIGVGAHPAAAPARSPSPDGDQPQASGGNPVGVYELVAQHSGKCLSTHPSQEDGAAAIQWTCINVENQQWSIQSVGDGYYRLIARHSGRCLSVHPSLEDGTAAVQWTCMGHENQQWTLVPFGSGAYVLRVRYSGKALDVSGASSEDGGVLVQNALSGAPNQQFVLRPISGQPQPGEPVATADIVRFLEQATLGPTPELIEHVRRSVSKRFLDEQFAAPMSSYPTLPLFPTTRDTTACPNGSTCQRDNYTMYPLQNRFFVNALYGEDQLRQRVAFALHQIIVVSGVEVTQPSWMAPYLQILDRNAFGNFRNLLYEITLNPAMGNYLDMHRQQDARDPERELCARSPSAVLDRHGPAEPRRHAAARRERPADPDVHAGRRSTISRACSPAGVFAAAPGAGVHQLHRSDGRQRGAARHRRQDAAERRRAARRTEHHQAI